MIFLTISQRDESTTDSRHRLCSLTVLLGQLYGSAGSMLGTGSSANEPCLSIKYARCSSDKSSTSPWRWSDVSKRRRGRRRGPPNEYDRPYRRRHLRSLTLRVCYVGLLLLHLEYCLGDVVRYGRRVVVELSSSCQNFRGSDADEFRTATLGLLPN